jgi:hypothetical protein
VALRLVCGRDSKQRLTTESSATGISSATAFVEVLLTRLRKLDPDRSLGLIETVEDRVTGCRVHRTRLGLAGWRAGGAP